MLPKKRILVGAIGATVALTLQTPVSAFIAKARTMPTAAIAINHPPPTFLAEAFNDGAQHMLGSDRWKGWRSDAGSTLADDFDGESAGHDTRVESTLGNLDLDDHGAASASAGRNSFASSANGDEQSAHASYIGGSGGGGGGGVGGAGGGGGGGGGIPQNALPAGMSGLGGGQEGSSSGLGPSPWHNNATVFHGVPAAPPVILDQAGNGGIVGNVETPEPGTLLFLGAGLAGLAARRARRSRSRGESAIR